jgi:hypothetical protein
LPIRHRPVVLRPVKARSGTQKFVQTSGILPYGKNGAHELGKMKAQMSELPPKS